MKNQDSLFNSHSSSRPIPPGSSSLVPPLLTVTTIALLFAQHATCRDLVEAAQTAQTAFNRIGIAAISIGITMGGILFALGFAMVGRMILISGLIGAGCILAAPSLIHLIGRIFGASL